MKNRNFFLSVLSIFLIFLSSLTADTKVAVSEISPMCFKGENGKMQGFSISLLNKVEDIIGEDFKLNTYDNVGAKLETIQKEESKLAIGGITHTYDRAKLMDSVHIMETGMKVISLEATGVYSWYFIIFKTGIWKSIIPFFIFLFVAGLIFYFLENGKVKKNKSGEITETTVSSIEDGVFLAATTASTVGYGHEAPITIWGRVFAVIIMIVGISYFAYVGSNVWGEASKAFSKHEVEKISDLKKFKVATVINTSNHKYLLDNKIKPITYKNSKELYQALLDKKVDLVVYDELSVLHFASNNENVIPVGPTFNKSNYVWFVSDSYKDKLKDLELALLKLRENGDFERLVNKWFSK